MTMANCSNPIPMLTSVAGKTTCGGMQAAGIPLPPPIPAMIWKPIQAALLELILRQLSRPIPTPIKTEPKIMKGEKYPIHVAKEAATALANV